MELEGTLKQFALSELLSLMVSSAVTGALALSGENESGRIWSRSGRLVHAIFGELRGVAALERMAELREARFRFQSGVKINDESLWSDPWLALGMVLRHERLMQKLRPYISSLSWQPLLRAEGGTNGVRLPADAWPLIAAADGQRSISEIAANLDYDRNNTALAFLWLAKRDLVSFQPPRRVRIRQLPSHILRAQQ